MKQLNRYRVCYNLKTLFTNIYSFGILFVFLQFDWLFQCIQLIQSWKPFKFCLQEKPSIFQPTKFELSPDWLKYAHCEVVNFAAFCEMNAIWKNTFPAELFCCSFFSFPFSFWWRFLFIVEEKVIITKAVN